MEYQWPEFDRERAAVEVDDGGGEEAVALSSSFPLWKLYAPANATDSCKFSFGVESQISEQKAHFLGRCSIMVHLV